jgi:multidrug efflux pump subunit AcrA (membrane-fusion protein)
VHRGQLELCFKVVPGPKPGAEKAHMKLVRPGEPLSIGAAGTFVEVLSGLDPGDRIVAAGGEGLKDGDSIEAEGEASSAKTEEKK